MSKSKAQPAIKYLLIFKNGDAGCMKECRSESVLVYLFCACFQVPNSAKECKTCDLVHINKVGCGMLNEIMSSHQIYPT